MNIKMFGLCLYLLMLTFAIYADEYPNEFQIHQEVSRRRFVILDSTQSLGTVLNSRYGQFDFYDKNEIKTHTNLEDNLFDKTGDLLSYIEWRKDIEAQKWFWQRKCVFCPFRTHMILYSNTGTPLITFDEEGEGKSFVFRDCETRKPLAVAFWSSSLLKPFYIATSDDLIQDWNLIIVDRSSLQEKRISFVFLIWALLKYSQLHFPNPDLYPYEQELK